MDITYIRLRSGFFYLMAFLDWFSRRVVAWELSETLELPFVLSWAFTTSSVRIRHWGTERLPMSMPNLTD